MVDPVITPAILMYIFYGILISGAAITAGSKVSGWWFERMYWSYTFKSWVDGHPGRSNPTYRGFIIWLMGQQNQINTGRHSIEEELEGLNYNTLPKNKWISINTRYGLLWFRSHFGNNGLPVIMIAKYAGFWSSIEDEHRIKLFVKELVLNLKAIARMANQPQLFAHVNVPNFAITAIPNDTNQNFSSSYTLQVNDSTHLVRTVYYNNTGVLTSNPFADASGNTRWCFNPYNGKVNQQGVAV